MFSSLRLVLASGSPQRLALLRQIGIEPVLVRASDMPEVVNAQLQPGQVVQQLAREKAEAVVRVLAQQHPVSSSSAS